jgi:hypothetical protein
MGDPVYDDRIESAIAGRLSMKDLGIEERVVMNARLNATIEAAVEAADFRSDLAAAGQTTVGLDELGRLVEHRPDGSYSVIGRV